MSSVRPSPTAKKHPALKTSIHDAPKKTGAVATGVHAGVVTRNKGKSKPGVARFANVDAAQVLVSTADCNVSTIVYF